MVQERVRSPSEEGQHHDSGPTLSRTWKLGSRSPSSDASLIRGNGPCDIRVAAAAAGVPRQIPCDQSKYRSAGSCTAWRANSRQVGGHRAILAASGVAGADSRVTISEWSVPMTRDGSAGQTAPKPGGECMGCDRIPPKCRFSSTGPAGPPIPIRFQTTRGGILLTIRGTFGTMSPVKSPPRQVGAGSHDQGR